MTKNPEQVIVVAGGMTYTEWERISISYAIKSACRTFTLVGTERPGAFNFPPGTPLQILANGDLVLDGYVNKYAPTGSADDHVVTISGRSRSQDFVDCAAVHETGFFENKSPDEIAQELDKFGVGVTAEVPLDKIPYWQIYQGESAWRTIDRALRTQAATQMGKADGSIAITNASVAPSHSGGLIEGFNILRFQGEITDDRRFSDYMVKGQGRLGHGDEALRPFGEAIDAVVGRYRPKILINEGDTDKKRATSRASHEKNRAAGLSVSAKIMTQGWRDDGGKIWEANYTVFVGSPTLLKLSQLMLIESVTLTQDSGGQGSLADLSLVDPRAYEGSGGGGGGSDAAWG